MLEIFQSIYNNFTAWLLGLGISATTIYTLYRIIKGVVYNLFQKKKKQAKHKADINSVAESTANILFDKLLPHLTDIHDLLLSIKTKLDSVDENVKNNENETINQLAIDTKAYQSVMLSQDADLGLAFETIRAGLISKSQKLKAFIADTCEDVSTIAKNTTEAVAENEEKIMEATEDVAEVVKVVKTTAKKVKEKVVTYD